MKVIKNKIFKLFMYLIGFAGIVMVFFCLFAAASTYEIFKGETDFTKPFGESNYIKSLVSSTFFQVKNSAEVEKKIKQADFDGKEITIFDYSDSGKSNKQTVKEFLDTKDVVFSLSGWLNNEPGLSSFEGRDNVIYLTEVAKNISGQYLQMTIQEYLNYIIENGKKYDSNLMVKYQNKWGDQGVDAIASSDEENVYKLIESLNFNNGLYLNEGDDAYYLYDQGQLLVYSQTNNYIYRTEGLTQAGHQNLDNLNTKYIYLNYTDKLDVNYIMNAYMYCSPEEAVYGIFDEKERLIIDEYINSLCYSDGCNSAFSSDGKDISGLYISDNYGISDIYVQDDGKYNVSFDSLCSQIEQGSEVLVRYDAAHDKVTEWYKTPDGKLKEINYLDKTQINEIKEIGTSFVIGARLYDRDCGNGTSYTSYRVCQMVPVPITFMVIGLIMFLLAVIFLTIGEAKKIYWIDKIPYFLIFLLMFLPFTLALYALAAAIRNVEDALFMVMTEPTGIILAMLSVAMIIYLFCAAIYLSFIRRIKCGKFLDGFIIVRIIRFLRKHLKGKTKLTFIIVAFIFAQLILALITLNIREHDEVIVSVMFSIILIIAFVMLMVKYMSDTEKIINISKRIEAGELDAKVDTKGMIFDNRELGENLNNLGDGLSRAVEASVRDERTKAELITNVSHDIKTPLTSIISYVDLLKRENIDNPKAVEYIDVLDKKSERLKQLILDLIEASKTSTGNIELEKMNLNLVELTGQVVGEYEDKFKEKNLELVENITVDSAMINADGRRVFRIIDNIFGNVYKYAQDNTRVYLNLGLGSDEKSVILSLKNVSKEMLNISADELTERFVRGDKSRSTEGSGLGLSIAKNLTELHDGKFKINIDGDLFTVIISLPLIFENIT